MRARWGLAAMAAAAVLAGGLANAADDALLPSGWTTTVRGAEGEDVVVGNLQVHVHGATASTRVDDLDGPLTSPGLFVAVDLSYATTDAWATPEVIVLIDGDGREYSDPSNLGLSGSTWLAGPDIWFRGDLLFEVPADAVTSSLTLEIRPETAVAVLPSTIGQIPLTVTRAEDPLEIGSDTLLAEGER